MSDKKAKEAELEHMENRTQWREADKERVEELRDEVESEEKGRALSQEEKDDNKVVHRH